MGWLRRFRTTWSQRDEDFEEERRFHIDALADRYVREGMTPDEARRAALRQFGNGTLIRDRTHDVDMFRWLDDLPPRRAATRSGCCGAAPDFLCSRSCA